MVSTSDSIKFKLVSNPYMKRVGLAPLIIAISFGWVFVFLWFGVSIYAFSSHNYWAVVLLGSTVAFACFLGAMSYGLIRDAYHEYTFEITDTEAVLVVNDKLKHKVSNYMILLDDIKYAEYYPYSDSSCVILKAPYYEMEVPLWPMGERGRDCIDFLIGRGIRVVNVQSDDPIPEPPQPGIHR